MPLYDLPQDHPHDQGGVHVKEIGYMMGPRGCNDAGYKLNESNRDQ